MGSEMCIRDSRTRVESGLCRFAVRYHAVILPHSRRTVINLPILPAGNVELHASQCMRSCRKRDDFAFGERPYDPDMPASDATR